MSRAKDWDESVDGYLAAKEVAGPTLTAWDVLRALQDIPRRARALPTNVVTIERTDTTIIFTLTRNK